MEVKAILKNAKISAFKARDVARAIQGKPALLAKDIVRLSPKKAARLIDKTLTSAIANAENNNNLRVQNLVVKEASIGEGFTMKRFVPKARGSAGPIRKRFSHIRIVLTERQVDSEKAARSEAKKKPKGSASEKATKES